MKTMKIDWEKFITVDGGWVAEHLTEHTIIEEGKLIIRTYSIQFTGTKYDTNSFAQFIAASIQKYVLNDKEIERIKKAKLEPFIYALQYFGNKNPTYDGKYGELVLYLLTEAVLKVPMVIFKLPTNPNDQIKGGDGLFCGDYKGLPAILIGEAKTWSSFKDALKDAFVSLDKFYKEYEYSALNYELFVATKNIRIDLSKEELDYIYQCFIPSTQEHKARVKVHPVLIIYDDENIDGINALNNQDGENKIKEIINQNLNSYASNVKELCKEFREVSEVYLDFFFIPMKSVDDFKHLLYKTFHSVEWRPKPVQSKYEVKCPTHLIQ